jgi:integrase
MKKLPITELVVKTTEATIDMGVDPLTAWAEHNSAYRSLLALHKEKEIEHLDDELLMQFMDDVCGRLDRGEIGWPMYRRIKRGIDKLVEYSQKGIISWTFMRKTSKFKLNPYYEKIVEDFMSQSDFHPNTRGDITWIARKYFAWLIGEGRKTLKGVGAVEIQGFLMHCSKHLKLGSIRNTMLYMKKLYVHLTKIGLSQNDYNELLSFRAVRGTRVYPAASPDDLACLLEQVDRRIPVGKRDYAIILLGAVTGLRAIDIIRLELSDIDWKRGEIKIVQEKTGVSLALPLTKDVGAAIEEYILRARPETNDTKVFIRNRKPYRGFKDSVSIGDMYDVYRKRAGLPRDPFDGNGFHSLRRGVGKNLTVAQVPITDVAQILGIRRLDVAKKYISLDSIHLKECAISFVGIEPTSIQGGSAQ